MNGKRSAIRGVALSLAGLAALGLAVFFLSERFREGVPPRNLILMVAAAAAGAGLLVLGWRAIGRARSGDPAADAPDYRHMVPLFGATVVVMGLLGLVLDALVPASYGRLGPYRGDALPAAAAVSVPRHVGEAACVDCHAREVTLHDKDAHARVPCESCHGPGRDHVAFRSSDAGRAAAELSGDLAADSAARAGPEGARMLVRKERQWCLRCHASDPARPGSFPQIVWTEHMRVSGIAPPAGENATTPDTTTLPCSTCHDPHEPLFMDRDLREARLHPLVHRCEDCHGRADASFVAAGTPERHPVTFECSYCHETVADEFTRSPHKTLDCTTCHVYFQESSFAGRIIRDADPRFCLLCHERRDFRRPDGPKMIKWPSHREAMRKDADDPRQNCIECHQSALHYPPPPDDAVDVDALFGDDEGNDTEDDTEKEDESP